jgi:hypothetical protein
MTWTDEHIEDLEALLRKLQELAAKGQLIACRGQTDSRWSLQASLDRLLDPNADYRARLAEEACILEKFHILAQEYLGQNEKKHLKSDDRINALSVVQHFRAPTRLLDWTRSPWVALYFAAIEHPDKDGAVWWFRPRAFEQKVDKRWEHPYRMKRYPETNKQVNLNDTAFNTDGPAWITMWHYRIPFPRIEAQQAFFTVAGRLGLDHAELIADVLDAENADGRYGRIIVPASLKQAILGRLQVMNIHSRTLDYPGADLVGSRLKRELKATQGRAAAD